MGRYLNPAAAVGECRRAGKKSAESVFVCATKHKPGNDASASRWVSEVWRLAKKPASGLSGSGRRRRRRRRK